ncbi:Na+/H+ antiporter [Terriglobus saanensis]|uniref:Na+/H+ antiporter n=1 Tax=Terriglobus saanensis (strain ATCC BAA-1853 / DSM 23119 / SP1PR4) TaxID=401053 RepID=E8V553_TERSS|nr:Na+/H+ antiporter [Terriglobus saanensis]ADV83740.1 Na+/H+ antiporter [Terriglobus saanensis SP1PR4]
MAEGFQVESVQGLLLGLLAMMVIIAGFARRLNVSYPIVLVIAGLVVSFIPGVPRFPLAPDVVFLVFLPPLLFAAAWQTSLREFRQNIASISMLAIGLVAFTVWVVAETADRFIPELDWKAGFLLGAIVSPTDAVAATSIARRLGLPRRIVDVLEGESLVNDATGLLALEFGIDMLLRGQPPTVTQGLLRLLWLLGGGVLVGLLIAVVVSWFERWVDDGPVEIAISVIVPYGAYLAGESVKASGVIAVVACGLYMARKSTEYFSPDTRLQVVSVWSALTFLLNGLVFLLIGLQLPYVLAGIRGYSHLALIGYGVAFSAILITARMIWVFPGAWVARTLIPRILHTGDTKAPAAQVFVVGWTGMRGVVALAAASSLPYVLGNGQPFAARNLIVFLTFVVILVTLVVQGLTLPPLIKALGLSDQGVDCEEGDARRIVLEAAIAYLEQPREGKSEQIRHAYEDLLHQYEHRLEGLTECGDPSVVSDPPPMREAARMTLQVERQALIQLRDQDRISDDTLRMLERELDLADSRLGSISASTNAG